ncbi:MAG TPA: menaquinone biosynthesis protein [Chthonomonadaceae bacterium]|nr:menaquinone biosynthesis protein [Chthonomonadaceae bacterium]
MTLRIGSVPYLNAKPLVDWFHTDGCDADVEIVYAVPSQLAAMLRQGELDVANCSIFEAFQTPDIVLVPNISISSNGPVKSVRLFSQTPMEAIRSVALDTSSLTSVALTKVLLSESFGLSPTYAHSQPDLYAMLARCDAALLIGDLKLFDLHPGTMVYDLGKGWCDLTGLPFVYAGWLARADRATPEMTQILTHAKEWGVARLDELAHKWADRMHLPLERCQDYLIHVMDYDLRPEQEQGLRLFQQKCHSHNLIPTLYPIHIRQD